MLTACKIFLGVPCVLYSKIHTTCARVVCSPRCAAVQLHARCTPLKVRTTTAAALAARTQTHTHPLLQLHIPRCAHHGRRYGYRCAVGCQGQPFAPLAAPFHSSLPHASKPAARLHARALLLSLSRTHTRCRHTHALHLAASRKRVLPSAVLLTNGSSTSHTLLLGSCFALCSSTAGSPPPHRRTGWR